MSDFSLNTRGLDDFIKAFKGKLPTVAVGVLAQKNARAIGTEVAGPAILTNAVVGAAHEFGTSKLPRRSFLRFPLFLYLSKRYEERELGSKVEMERIIKTQDITPWLKKIGILAEEIVQEAFATGGFGAWKQSNMAKKKVHQTLIETQQLRNSITSEVR